MHPYQILGFSLRLRHVALLVCLVSWHWPGGCVGHGCDYVRPGEWSQPQWTQNELLGFIPSISIKIIHLYPSNPRIDFFFFRKDRQWPENIPMCCWGYWLPSTYPHKVVGLAVSYSTSRQSHLIHLSSFKKKVQWDLEGIWPPFVGAFIIEKHGMYRTAIAKWWSWWLQGVTPPKSTHLVDDDA